MTAPATEATILRGTLKSVLLTLQTAAGARSERACKLLVEDALAGLRIGLDLAREEGGMTDRESLLDDMAGTETAMRYASEWARRLAREACQSGCHLAATKRVFRADAAWQRARDALDDHDYDGETVAFHTGIVNRLVEAHYPTEKQITASLDRMDHVLGPGWLEEGERYWAAHYAERATR